MRKLIFVLLLCLITTSAFGQFQHKPMLGVQVDGAHPHGDFVSAWFFLEGSGNTVSDLSGNGKNGTFAAGAASPSWVAGKFGPAVSFDGGDYITVSDTDQHNANLVVTASGWFKSGDIAVNQMIVSKRSVSDDGWYIYLTSSKLRFFIEGVAGTPVNYLESSTLSSNTWYHFAVVWNDVANTMSIYIDGVLDVTDTTKTGSSVDAAVDLHIGVYSRNQSLGFNGLIDHLLIHNRVLSASEIAELYREPFGMFVKEDIAILATAAEPPPPPTGQVITIIMTSIPLFLIPFFFIKRRKLYR